MSPDESQPARTASVVNGSFRTSDVPNDPFTTVKPEPNASLHPCDLAPASKETNLAGALGLSLGSVDRKPGRYAFEGALAAMIVERRGAQDKGTAVLEPSVADDHRG